MAIRFNGTSDYLSFASGLITAAPLTMVAWSRTTSGSIVSISSPGSPLNFFDLQTTTALVRGFCDAGGVASFASGVGYNVGWAHYAGVYASTTSRQVYTNGLQVGTNATSAAPASLTVTSIGARQSNTNVNTFSLGLIADVAIYSVALTAGEIAALAAGARPWQIRPSALVACVTGENSVSYDLMGRIWTVNGSPKLVAEMPPAVTAKRGAFWRLRASLNAFTVTAAQGAFTLTGNAAGLLSGRKLAAVQGSYAETGNAAGLFVGRKLVSAQGAYTLTGQAASFLKGFSLNTATGSFTLTGEAASLKRTARLSISTGAYSLVGELAHWRRGFVDSGVLTATASPLHGSRVIIAYPLDDD